MRLLQTVDALIVICVLLSWGLCLFLIAFSYILKTSD